MVHLVHLVGKCSAPGISPAVAYHGSTWRTGLRRGDMADNSSQPAYQALANRLRQRIEDGHIAPGQALPSATALMSEYGVSSTVVKNAMRELRASGHVVGQQGKAVYARLPTAPTWLASLISAGSQLAALVERETLEGREEPLKDWQQALADAPSYARRASEQGV